MKGVALSLAFRHPTAVAGPPAWVAVAVLGATVLAFVLAAAWVMSWSSWDGQRGDDGDGEDGGGGRRPDPPAPSRPPDGEPVWWPEFEREFAAHVARVARGARSVKSPR